MDRLDAVRAAQDLRARYFPGAEPREDGAPTGNEHLAWMVQQMCAALSEGKTMRWLGYIQGVLVARGASLADMKELNRVATATHI